MRYLFSIATCALTLALTGPAFAQAGNADPSPGAPAGTEVRVPNTEARVPNFFGASGLLAAPSAYVQGRNTATAFVYGHEDFINGGFLAGLADRFEVGLGILGGLNGFGRDNVNFLANAKLSLLQESGSRPALAVGVTDAFDRLNVGPSWYVVASKYFTRTELETDFALKGHAGFGGGIYDEEPFFGGELFFGPNFSAIGEFVNSRFNLGARYNYRGWAASMGVFDFSDFGGGLSYTAKFR